MPQGIDHAKRVDGRLAIVEKRLIQGDHIRNNRIVANCRSSKAGIGQPKDQEIEERK